MKEETIEKLTARNLKNALWEVLKDIRAKNIGPQEAEAVASQSREIIRVIRTQQSILKQASQTVTDEMMEFVSSIEA
jgi:hypothetical protein